MHCSQVSKLGATLDTMSAKCIWFYAPLNQPISRHKVSKQNLLLNVSERLFILSSCQGIPMVWGQEACRMPAKMGSWGPQQATP
eukprot:1146889-Pelagomonas_calceolata.AAC.4